MGKNTCGCKTVDQEKMFDENARGKRSPETVPLISTLLSKTVFILITHLHFTILCSATSLFTTYYPVLCVTIILFFHLYNWARYNQYPNPVFHIIIVFFTILSSVSLLSSLRALPLYYCNTIFFPLYHQYLLY
jgi:hypothetical protein